MHYGITNLKYPLILGSTILIFHASANGNSIDSVSLII